MKFYLSLLVQFYNMLKEMFNQVFRLLRVHFQLFKIILYNISKTEWYQVYTYIRFYGLNDHLYIQDNYMLKADGIQDAIKYNFHY